MKWIKWLGSRNKNFQDIIDNVKYMLIIEYNKIPISISGNHPVVKLILKELELLNCTTKNPMINFNIVKDRIHPERGSLVMGDGIYVGAKDFYIRHSAGFINYLVRVSPNKNSRVLNIEISCDPSVIPDNLLKKSIDFGYKIINRTYIPRIEQMSYNIINGVFEPIFLFFTQNDRTLIHASSIVKDDNVMIIGGWGATGKTSASMNLVYKHDWKFLSDDIALIGIDGIAYLNPRYPMIYAYNVKDNEQLYNTLMKGRSFADKLHWKIRTRLLGAKLVRRRVSPTVIFGKEKIGSKGDISKVIHLIRHKNKKFQLKKINPKSLAVRSANVIAVEYSRYVKCLRALRSTEFPIPPIEKIIRRIEWIYAKAFKKSDCFLLLVPERTSPIVLADFIEKNIVEG